MRLVIHASKLSAFSEGSKKPGRELSLRGRASASAFRRHLLTLQSRNHDVSPADSAELWSWPCREDKIGDAVGQHEELRTLE